MQFRIETAATVQQILGVSAAEWTPLIARPKPGSSDVNQIFQDLVDNTWEPVLEGGCIGGVVALGDCACDE